MAFVPVILTADVKEIAELASTDVDIHIVNADTFVTEALGDKGLSDDLFRLIGLYISAHFSFLFEGQVKSEKIGDSSTTYNMISKLSLLSTVHGQQAVSFDTTGTLAKLVDQIENPASRFDSPGTVCIL
jgi:hypothetical protein